MEVDLLVFKTAEFDSEGSFFILSLKCHERRLASKIAQFIEIVLVL